MKSSHYSNRRSVNALGLGFPVLTAAALLAAAGFCVRASAARAADDSLAQRAHTLLVGRCSFAGCHGGQNPAFGINMLQPESLITAKVLVRGDAAKSEMIDAVTKGRMPLTGAKLTTAEVKLLSDWVNAGAPDSRAAAGGGGPRTRAQITESATLKAILHDLEDANQADRPFLRYYSLANVSNDDVSEVPDQLLQVYSGALTKLLNHLSWSPDLVHPKAADSTGMLLRIDLRELGWTADTWQSIIAAYPYGEIPRGLRGTQNEITTLSGADIPYIRADWFVTFASVPPLYHTILGIPQTAAELEKRLQVDVAGDIDNGSAQRAGVRNSGISHNNRIIERHRAAYGAYWRSYDFATNADDKNIFLDPLNFHEDGGEIIFNLPNSLQGYMLINAKGERLNDGLTAIVRDNLTNHDDPVVHNGRSCIGCHITGMNPMANQVRNMLETESNSAYDLQKALQLYVPQQSLNQLLAHDSDRFTSALRTLGAAVPTQVSNEPVNMLSQYYLTDVSTRQAAADAGLPVDDFIKRVERSQELQKLGFGQLTASGGIKRDAWEQYFGNMVQELGLGEYIKPTQFRGAGVTTPDAVRRTVRVSEFSGPGGRQAQVRLIERLRLSDDLQLVGSSADIDITGTVTTVGDDRLTLVARAPAQGLSEEVSGANGDLAFLAEQLADKVSVRLTGRAPRQAAFVPGVTAPVQPAGGQASADPAVQIAQAFSSGPVHIALSIDRGPGSTYRSREFVHVRFKVDHDCFVQIKDVDSAGNITNLFPNEFSTNGYVTAGQIVELNDDKGQSVVTVDENGTFGQETIIAFATLQQQSLPGVQSKTLKVESHGAGQFVQSVTAAPHDAVSTATIQFRSAK